LLRGAIVAFFPMPGSRHSSGVNEDGRRFLSKTTKSREGAHARVEESNAERAVARRGG
jgi:hypothetical protein